MRTVAKEIRAAENVLETHDTCDQPLPLIAHVL
jgi:hypothetical protein